MLKYYIYHILIKMLFKKYIVKYDKNRLGNRELSITNTKKPPLWRFFCIGKEPKRDLNE